MSATMKKYHEVGQSTTSQVDNTQRKEVEVEVYIGENGYVQNAGFTIKPIAALEKGKMDGPKAIVLHRTEGASVQSALDSAGTGIGTHFYVDKDGTVYQTASLLKHTYHVGKIKSRCMVDGTCPADETRQITGWGWSPSKVHNHEKVKAYPARYPMNTDSVGIETVSRCVKNCGPKDKGVPEWEPPTAEQKSSIATIVGILKKEYGLTSADIHEHDLISYKTAGEGAGLYDDE
ncbi:N-acetylmuramoyl-L-alanine amidase [Luteimonas sp. MJ250]|uniref:N-acetylmuramoyl-L-alanine amidase n=1 Tax=Luteimonas sp. MJ250 TaxID=3129236 RepID=UPI0031B9D760